MTAGSTKLIWSWSRRMRSASPTERNYPNAEIVMHENEPAHWFDDEKCKGHQPGAEIVLSGLDGVRFHIEPRRRSLHLAGDHAKANDEIERRQRGKGPRTVKAHRKTGLAQEHADVDRVARVKRYGPFSTIAVVGLLVSTRVPALRIVVIAQIASTKPTENTAQSERTWGQNALRRPWHARRKLSPRR